MYILIFVLSISACPVWFALLKLYKRSKKVNLTVTRYLAMLYFALICLAINALSSQISSDLFIRMIMIIIFANFILYVLVFENLLRMIYETKWKRMIGK